MIESTAGIICCPKCKGKLTFSQNPANSSDSAGTISCNSCNQDFTSGEGYLDFLGDEGLVFSSKREKIIRSAYAKVYTPVNNMLFLFCGGAKNAREEVMSELVLEENSRVLETGMGAGENYLWMKNKSLNLSFYGIDIQKQMMEHCTRNIKKWGMDVELFRANALELPFKSETFDVVFHLGAINLFPDKRKAIEEMIGVSRPGKTIVIADETDKASKLFNLFTGANEKVTPPLDMVPESMLNLSMKIIWRGYGYLIKFTKP